MNDKAEILVIASDPETRKALSSILQTEGLKSVQASQLSEGRALLPTNPLASCSVNATSPTAHISIFCRSRSQATATFPLSLRRVSPIGTNISKRCATVLSTSSRRPSNRAMFPLRSRKLAAKRPSLSRRTKTTRI